MKQKTRRMLIAAGAILLLVVLVRESGMLDFHLYTSQANSMMSTSKWVMANETLDREQLDFSIWPSPLDYIPLYKHRTFEGVASIGEADGYESSSLTVNYEITLTVKGICSGHRFRSLARDKVLEQVDAALEK